MFQSEIQIRVRYGETDKMGFVYYGNYALYYEQGRTEAIRSIGLSYKDLEETGIQMPVIQFEIKYLRPAYYDDLLNVQTTIAALDPDAREITFKTSIFNQSLKKLNEGIVTLAFIDMFTGKRCKIPTLLYEKLKAYY